jgi:glycosyltransferase involved in cell wall biosynthesis
MEAIGIKSENICISPNGIDLEQIQKIEPSDERSDIVFAGRLIKEKNVDLLLRAVSIIKSSNPDIRCIIMGDGPEREKLLRLQEELGLKNNISFAGFVEYEELIGNIKASRVLALPSKREGFGIIAIEGFACGKPVVTVNSKDNATQEIVTDSVNGFIIKAEGKALARALHKILVDKSLYDNLSGNATMESHRYDWNQICTSCIDTYRLNL